ncbi:MAG: arginine--tRNA ligase [Bacteroidetes bacterium]|nr:arginine--tRNA ligase [Bacteroidota bacterium]
MIIQEIQQAAAEAVQSEFGVEIDPGILPIQETRKDFEGDFTIVVFPLTKLRLGNPQQIGERIGAVLTEKLEAVESYNVIKGFLNLSLSSSFWRTFMAENHDNSAFFKLDHGTGKTVVVEYCSPNTNKPLHLGHLRNITLGYAVTEILKANGYEVHPTCLFNDRGTNISKSMFAWMEKGKNDSPEELGIKGDKFVGNYYVEFARKMADEAAAEIASGVPKQKAEANTPSMKAVHDMTVKWEEGDAEIRNLWEKMNGWVYEAFHQTFERLGVSFERFYYESQVYQRGKETVEEGLEKGIFTTTEDGSVEIDLTDDGMDKKTLLRSNGTSLYVTQDLAIAEDKFNEFHMDKSIYVVGNEQDYHFKVLFKILQKLGKTYGEGLFHLSYGMVDLPTGKMKSREGTTVDADDLMDDMEQTAREETQKNPDRVEGMSDEELNELAKIVGIGALKYYLAKVDPKKRMLFDPNESIDLKGNTGPFIQYSYTRTQAVKRKSEGVDIPEYDAKMIPEEELLDSERVLLKLLFKYADVLKEAGEGYNPALIANYAYELAKEYNRFYHEAKILRSDFPKTSAFRFALSGWVGEALKEAMGLLGIGMPSRM